MESYAATGMPVFASGQVSPATFAIAFADSVGGLVITSFQATTGTRGDLFILQLTSLQPGTFGPCGVGAGCHGRLLEGIDADNLHDVEAAWEIVDGTLVLEAAADRAVGSFTNFELRSADGASTRTVTSGSFDLPLLDHAEGTANMQCFLARATGGSCPG